jgi:hypothetical protein
MKLTVDTGFAHPAGDELRILRAEIKDKDLLMVHYDGLNRG